jgi:hypothetical protein
MVIDPEVPTNDLPVVMLLKVGAVVPPCQAAPMPYPDEAIVIDELHASVAEPLFDVTELLHPVPGVLEL